MCEGEKRHVIVPPGLAYGVEGRQDYVPGHATLYFALEMVKLQTPRMTANVILRGVDSSPAVVTEGAVLTLNYSAYVVNESDECPQGELCESSQLEAFEPQSLWGPFLLDENTDIITGLRYGLLGMCLGEKRELLIQPQLAWQKGIVDYVRADATVLFRLELVSLAQASGSPASDAQKRKGNSAKGARDEM